MSFSEELFPLSETSPKQISHSQRYQGNQEQRSWLTFAQTINPAAPVSKNVPPVSTSAFPLDFVSSNLRDYDEPERVGVQHHNAGDTVQRPFSHLPLSAFELTTSWQSTSTYSTPLGISENLVAPPFTDDIGPPQLVLGAPESPYSTGSFYIDSPLSSPYFSSPELGQRDFDVGLPRSLPADDCECTEEDSDALGVKPYARLIFEALMQAPGHRMMLRDIYEWFELNTTKPRESGTNGWQNSIRHNLSMNHAFENDKTQYKTCNGEPKKATSIWYLTENAIRNGVQSTTRYRKIGATRKANPDRKLDAQRAKSGAKGGRAAKRAAKLRRMHLSPQPSWAAPMLQNDLTSFNRLVHVANIVKDCPTTRSNSPPSPADQHPYTPGSPVSRESGAHFVKCESRENAFCDIDLHELLFRQPFETGFDDNWSQMRQRD